MATKSEPVIGVKLTLDNGETFEIMEGDIVSDLTFKGPAGVESCSGNVRALVAATLGYNKGPQGFPPSSYLKDYIAPQRLIVDTSDRFSASIEQIDLDKIVAIGEVVAGEKENEGLVIVAGVGAAYRPLPDIIESAPEGATILLEPGEYSDDLNLTKSVIIRSRGKSNTAVVLSGAISIGNEGDETGSYVIDNVTLTGNSTITVKGGAFFQLTDSIFFGHNITRKTMPVAITARTPMMVTISNNQFLDEPAGSYNLIDVYAKLISGSTISGNYFSAACCSHNQISLYGIDDGAYVYISDNNAEKSANMIRIGFIGEPTGVVNIVGNRYFETDSEELWQGLFLVQPYGRETVSFAGLTINVSDTTYPEGTQLCYLFAGSNDTPFDETNKPKAFLDGVEYDIIDNSPVAVQARQEADADSESSGDDSDQG